MMGRTPRILLTGLLLAAPLAAAAASLPIDGKYGNKAGCAYAGTGESDGADDFFLLTPEAMTTAASVCEIRTVGKTVGNATSVVFSCQAEGEDGAADSPAKVIKAGRNAYTVTFDDGTVWGPLARCR
jgi:hypothetical protein